MSTDAQRAAGGWRDAWRGLSRRAKLAVVATGAFVAAAGGWFGAINSGLDLYDRLFPPPKPIVPTLTAVAGAEPDITWGTFLEEHPAVDGSFTASHRATLGSVFRVNLTGEGGKTFTIRWVQRNRDGARIATPDWVPRALEVEVREGSPTVRDVWAPLPAVEDEYFLDYTVLDAAGEARATATSERVRVGH